MLYPINRGVMQIDEEDIPLISHLNWGVARGRNGVLYAQSTVAPHRRAHTLILIAPPGLMVDHQDRDGLNNQRSNLRLATPSQNAANRAKNANPTSSLYKGVYFVNRENWTGHWQAYVSVNRSRVNLGYFETEEEAARAYDSAARFHYGEFAYLNFPDEIPAPYTPRVLRVSGSLTADQVREIRILLSEGLLTHREIGERYGMSKSAITAIRAGRTWRDIF
jgi:hypothetical protein